jgi:phage terminase large subunit
MPLVETTALRKVSAMKGRTRVIRGGQGAGKTISVLILLINHASRNSNKEILIVSSELTKMRLTVIKDFIKVMRLIGIYEDARFLAGTLYKFPNGSFIKFIGLDKADVGKGLRSDVVYFNEVNKCDFESYRQLASRSGIVYADYNPDAEFFIDTEVLGREGVSFLQLTYKDNEQLSDTERTEIESYKERGYHSDGSIKNEYWANLWEVYGCGNVGALVGAVYSNRWEEIQDIPEEARLIGIGLDFGYSVDPTAAIEIYKYNNAYILNEVIYQKELSNREISQMLKGKRVPIVCDSAEPKSIAELQSYGLIALPVQKGADSINNGIQRVQGIEILITKRSINTIKEKRSYTWAINSKNQATGLPVDKNNHGMDATRYGFAYLLQHQNIGRYRIR